MAVGGTPNLAARVQGLAGADEIVIAPTTQRLLGAAFELEDRGERMLRGIVEPVRTYRVRGASAVQDRFETSHGAHVLPLVGRDSELTLLMERWRQAVEGEGQVLVLCGEPGVGKSRIARALRARLEANPMAGSNTSARRSSPILRFIRSLPRSRAQPASWRRKRARPSSISLPRCSNARVVR